MSVSVSRSRILDLQKRQRLGNKVLRQRLKGPALAQYYPRRSVTHRDLVDAFKHLDLVTWDEEEEDRLEALQMYVLKSGFRTLHLQFYVCLVTNETATTDEESEGREHQRRRERKKLSTMASGSIGNDEIVSGAKLEPVSSSTKAGTEHDLSGRGAAGTDRNIDQTRIDPLGGKARLHDPSLAGQYQHTAPHADSSGVIGREEEVSGSKIEPLSPEEGSGKQSGERERRSSGLDDETVDRGRIDPMGSQREEVS
ncbi:MAG: hypothetical protein Q9227_004641 [Pyrenula ochraceoflavens]